MSIRKISFAPGEFYHIYNRGNSKQKIFHDEQDHKIFLRMIYLLNQDDRVRLSDFKDDFFKEKSSDTLVSIGAYVLMPNHFHILLTEKKEGSISKFMQKLSTAYVMYYNQKYKRIGSLFEGKFKSRHADTDRYLKYLFSYIHLNPIKLIDKEWKEKGIKNRKASLEFLESYNYSSYLYFLSLNREDNKILDLTPFPSYFTNIKDFKNDILDWLGYDM